MKQPISILPALALRGTTILPDMIVHFDVSRERSMKAIEAAMLQDEKIFLVTQKDPEIETPEIKDLYKVGTVAYIKQVVKLPHDLLPFWLKVWSDLSLSDWNRRIHFLWQKP